MVKLNNSVKITSLAPTSKIRMPLRLLKALSFVLFLLTLFNTQSCGAKEPTDDPAESLLSLPYMQYVKKEKAPDKVGTTLNKKDKAFQGYSLYASHNDTSTFINLIDMNNSLIHQWKINQPPGPFSMRSVTPFSDGSIFMISNQGWQRIDATSRSIANYKIPQQKAHHAACWLKTGGFLGLVSNVIDLPFEGITIKIQDNSLVHISPDGQILKIIPLSKIFSDNPSYPKILKECYDNLYLVKPYKDKNKKRVFDLFHANNIENLEWDIPGIAKKGDWLVTVPRFNTIIIVDPKQEKIIWQWGENMISFPHHATFLKGSLILLFDNGNNKKSSRVIILDTKSKKIVWQYGQKPNQKFFTNSRGSAQRLPNGNTLIVESMKGRAFEVTTSGEIVWEWYADFFTEGKYQKKRKTIDRMTRLPYGFFKNVKFNYGKTQP